LATFSLASKAVLAVMVLLFVGNRYFAEGILSTDGMRPMGAGLQEPVVIWRPLVRGVFGRVRAQ
jgi:hypothetical protein